MTRNTSPGWTCTSRENVSENACQIIAINMHSPIYPGSLRIPKRRATCPNMSGNRTVDPSVAARFVALISADTPEMATIREGVKKTPRRLPKELFTTDTAALPPLTAVRMTAEEMGGGRHPSTSRPDARRGESTEVFRQTAATAAKIAGHAAKWKSWTHAETRQLRRARPSWDVWRERPLPKNIVATPITFMVTSGRTGPPLTPSHGAR
mmetsp:Transcript_9702/g.21583  ORF Transcript_9702/g.21583 Transcript_9702/m.21583 type:complete len:209 (+) Transcript_9702:893-1519(+)